MVEFDGSEVSWENDWVADGFGGREDARDDGLDLPARCAREVGEPESRRAEAKRGCCTSG